MEMETHVEHITPAQAKEYLKSNTNNYRTISRSKVREYADAMKSGRWELNGEGIKFAENGTLKDGQTRLAAIIMSGKTIAMNVTRNVANDVQIYDVGKVRSNSEIGKAMGFECDSTIMAAANIIVNRFGGRSRRTEVIDYAQKHASELNRSMRITTYGTGCKSKNAPCVTATYLMLRTKKMTPYELELFFRLMNEIGRASCRERV